MLHIVITRQVHSLAYLRDPRAPNAWGNNDANNSLDQFALYLDGVAGCSAPLFVCRAQTVANLEGLDAGSQTQFPAHFSDTILPGPFQLRAFVDPRNFWCHPHGICNVRTIHGDWIGEDSTTEKNKSRWLMHDWQKLKPNPQGQDTRVAWSAGCIVVPTLELPKFSAALVEHGVHEGDLIDGEIVMEG